MDLYILLIWSAFCLIVEPGRLQFMRSKSQTWLALSFFLLFCGKDEWLTYSSHLVLTPFKNRTFPSLNFSWVYVCMGFPGDTVAKILSANAGDTDSIPGSRRMSGGRHGKLLQYSCLDLMDRRAWRGLRGSKSQTRLSNWAPPPLCLCT